MRGGARAWECAAPVGAFHGSVRREDRHCVARSRRRPRRVRADSTTTRFSRRRRASCVVVVVVVVAVRTGEISKRAAGFVSHRRREVLTPRARECAHGRRCDGERRRRHSRRRRRA